jgi:hypothetical protein
LRLCVEFPLGSFDLRLKAILAMLCA